MNISWQLGEYGYCQTPSLGCRYAACLTDEKKTDAAAAAMRKKMIEDLAKWIDAHAIAEAIVDSMESAEVQITLEAAEKVWLSFLECELSDALETRIDELLDNDQLEPVEDEQTEPTRPRGAALF